MSFELPPSPVNEKLGVTTTDLPDGRVQLSLAADESFHNEIGFVHGGITTFLLDGAMGRCCGRTLNQGDTCATVQLSVQFIAKAEGTITAVAEVTRSGGRIAFLEGRCHREDGTLVARAQGTWAIRRRVAPPAVTANPEPDPEGC